MSVYRWKFRGTISILGASQVSQFYKTTPFEIKKKILSPWDNVTCDAPEYRIYTIDMVSPVYKNEQMKFCTKNGQTFPFVWYKSFYVCPKEKRKSEIVKLRCLRNISTGSNHRLSVRWWLYNYTQTSPFNFSEKLLLSLTSQLVYHGWSTHWVSVWHAIFITLILLAKTQLKTRRSDQR